jgi:hypothetical protein
VASDLALEVIGDFAIVWFLSPRLSLTPKASSAVTRWTQSLPAFALQVPLSTARIGRRQH